MKGGRKDERRIQSIPRSASQSRDVLKPPEEQDKADLQRKKGGGKVGREGFCELKISFGVGSGYMLHHGLRFIKGESPDGHVIASMGTDEMKVSRVK